MELKFSSPKVAGLSPSDCVSDPEEKEISDDDDNDRNHKHRRREIRSQSLEIDAPEQVLIRPYRKRNKPLENGHSYRENDSQSTETWRRRPGLATFPRNSVRTNQSLSTELVTGKGRARDSSSWSQRDSRFTTVDIASQMMQQGSIPPNLFAGRGLANVSSSQSPLWNAFGLIPGIPNGSLDTLHPLGLHGALRPSINPSLNVAIPRQRCRDFEERGFCLRGDMCPMEHGVNRIVVEDVQSLSQFNLPVSLSSAHLLGTTPVLPSASAVSSTMINSKSLNGKNTTSGMADALNGASAGSISGGGADFYDPDQPLWTSVCPETSRSLPGLNTSALDETEYVLDPSDRQHIRLFDGFNREHPIRSKATAVGPQIISSSVRGQIGIKSGLDMKEKIDSTSKNIDEKNKEDREKVTHVQVGARQGKQVLAEEIGSQKFDSSLRTQSNAGCNIQKPSQKALCTLFINGIPQKDNRREALLSHFKKFGDVIDIYIPMNSERAFVQFSNREEAEAALKAPDAVMGNRFIKLWWANRDNIPIDGMNSVNNASVPARGLASISAPPQASVSDRGKDNFQFVSPKMSAANVSLAALPPSDHPKFVTANGPKGAPPLQKKMESLELLKVKLRKKQELLDQKRNEFKRQLDKLEKQATGPKDEAPSLQASKKQKVALVADVTKTATLSSAGPGTVVTLSGAEVSMDKINSMGNVVLQSPRPISSSTHSVHPLFPAGASFMLNRFKLDNRSTAFKIVPPLPSELANVAALMDHFSPYGELSTVELEGVDSGDSEESNNCCALVSFANRRAAETAFVNGKCWQGNNLQFVWVASPHTRDEYSARENSPASKGLSEGEPSPAAKTTALNCQNVTSNEDGEPAKVGTLNQNPVDP